MLHSITANVTGKTRRQFRGGREYLVAPLTLIVPGVLNGSQGPLYYPADEIERDFMAWNEMPIVVYHPQSTDGSHVSAQSPGVLDKQGIGYVRRPAYNGKLTAEGWFDAERTRTVDQRVYDALLRNEPQELSTGLYTDNEPAENGSTAPDGKLYTHVARNYRPDHLAILPDQIGACSLRDGCGVLVNKEEGAVADVENWSQSQPRDDNGRWGSGGGASMAPDKGGNFGGGGTGDASKLKTEYLAIRDERDAVQEQIWKANDAGKPSKRLKGKLEKLFTKEGDARQKWIDAERASNPKAFETTPPKQVNPAKSVKGTTYKAGELHDASIKAGQKLFGKELEHAGTERVQTKKLSSMPESSRHVGDFEYVFYPSNPGRGKDSSGALISKKLADKDGKVYLYDAEQSTITVVTVNESGDTTVPLEEKLSVLQSLAVLLGVENAYNPNQPRDAKGQFGSGGGGATGGKGASKAHGAAKSGAGAGTDVNSEVQSKVVQKDGSGTGKDSISVTDGMTETEKASYKAEYGGGWTGSVVKTRGDKESSSTMAWWDTGDNIYQDYKPAGTTVHDAKMGIPQGVKRQGISVKKGSAWVANNGQSGQTRNQRRRRSDMTKSREEIVDNLIENSCCWDEADRDELMDLTDNQLNKLDTALEKQLQADAVVNAAREGFGMDSKITVNAMPEFIKKKMAAADEEEEEVVDEEKPTGNVLTREQMEDIAFARSIKQERKDVAIGVITSNAQNKFTKEQLNAMPLDTLQNLAALAKPLVNESQNVPSYFGASVPPTANVGTKDDDNDYLPLPTVNWAKPEA